MPRRSKLDELLAWAEEELEYLNRPDPYQDTMYYERKDGKITAFEDVINRIKSLKEE